MLTVLAEVFDSNKEEVMSRRKVADMENDVPEPDEDSGSVVEDPNDAPEPTMTCIVLTQNAIIGGVRHNEGDEVDMTEAEMKTHQAGGVGLKLKEQ